MPIVGSPSTGATGSTILSIGGLASVLFGNAALPNGQGTLGWINLNDGLYTFMGDFNSDDNNRQLGLAQLIFRARSAYISDDFGPRTFRLPLTYVEDSTHFLGQFLASLSQAGEQQLTFDNAVTYTPAKYQGISNRRAVRAYTPIAWTFTLEFIAKSPWFQDTTATAMAPLTLTVDAGQSFNITYAGSVWAEPIWTLVVPATNAVAINSMQLKNTMSGEFLTVNFLSVAAIPALTARTITINCALMTAVDNLGNNFDITGSFPMLYPPSATVNAFTVIITPASGSSSGLTLACSHNARWQI